MLDATEVIQQARAAASGAEFDADRVKGEGRGSMIPVVNATADAAVRVVLQELRERFPATFIDEHGQTAGRLIAGPELHRVIDELLEVLDGSGDPHWDRDDSISSHDDLSSVVPDDPDDPERIF